MELTRILFSEVCLLACLLAFYIYFDSIFFESFAIISGSKANHWMARSTNLFLTISLL